MYTPILAIFDLALSPIMYTLILTFKPRLHLMFFLCMCYTFLSTKSYDMHKGVHDWPVNSGEMVIYAFLKKFKSDSQRYVTSRSRQSDQNYKHLSHTTCTTKIKLVKCNR